MALPVHLWLASLSRCHSRAIGVLFCRAFLSVRPRWLGGPKIVPGRDNRRLLRLGVGIESRRFPGARLALPPPFPAWGSGPRRRETSTATVATTRHGGRCYTRPCAHAKGPSSFSAVRRQVWLNRPSTRPQGERSSLGADRAAPVPLALADCRAGDWQVHMLNGGKTHTASSGGLLSPNDKAFLLAQESARLGSLASLCLLEICK